jgi:hypothetical protein
MLRLRRKTRSEKVTEALKEAASYTDRIVHDRRLRSDLRSAVEHGARAAKLAQRDLRDSRGAARIAGNAKLRKSVRALVDDMSRATGRVQRKRQTHRVRNAFLLVGGTGAALAAATGGRHLVVRSRRNGTGVSEAVSA